MLISQLPNWKEVCVCECMYASLSAHTRAHACKINMVCGLSQSATTWSMRVKCTRWAPLHLTFGKIDLMDLVPLASKDDMNKWNWLISYASHIAFCQVQTANVLVQSDLFFLSAYGSSVGIMWKGTLAMCIMLILKSVCASTQSLCSNSFSI